MTEPLRRIPVTRITAGGPRADSDAVTAEEPLEIRLAGVPLAVVMRTPGDDIALAAGFMLTEGILPGPDAIGSIAHCTDSGTGADNVVNVIPSEGVAVDAERHRRGFFASSSCGLCGKASIESVRLAAPRLSRDWPLSPDLVSRAVAALAGFQPVFAETGSIHAAALVARDGSVRAAAEDVGRHNAVDKVAGRVALTGDHPASDCILCVSGRISFEITQKAAMAGIPVVAAVSGASSLAVELARETGMTLAGFVRGGSMTLYVGTLDG